MVSGEASSPRRKCPGLLLIAALIPLIVLSLSSGASVQASPVLRGVVVDGSGVPVKGARVSLWAEEELLTSTVTDPSGVFELEAIGESFIVYALADLEETSGIDYLPARAEVTGDAGEIVLTLLPGASLILEGDIQFVESEDLPDSYLLTAIDPISDRTLEADGLPLVYGSSLESISPHLGLDQRVLIVPAGVPFKVGVNSSILVGREMVHRYFEVEETPSLTLGMGEESHIDIRRFSIPFSLDISEDFLDRIRDNLDEMEGLGFYLTTERGGADSISRMLAEVHSLLEEGRLGEGFDKCKRGYIALEQNQARLDWMMRDASISVYSLVAFLALASATVAFLLADRSLSKILGSLGTYAAMLAVFYVIYPGSAMVSLEMFIAAGILSIALSLLTALALPRFMKGGGGDAHLPVRNMIVPIYSIAKRSVRRRRMRFTLTVSSIIVLVMSFVSLTSFSVGYGLVVRRVSDRAAEADGVLIRAPGYTEMEPVFLTERDLASRWLERQPESATVAPKAESIPTLRPFLRLQGQPLFGVLGLDPALEPSVAPVEGALIEGQLPSENGAAITRALKQELTVEIGDTLFIDGLELRLEGVLDGEVLSELEEADGSPYLPKKLVNKNPVGEIPMIVAEPCEPTEFIVLHIERALQMPFTWIARAHILMAVGFNPTAFAEKLALQRGYWVWSASSEGVHIARLGEYIEQKGLPLMIPWAIVVLNVVVTMLNSMFERRREIHVLSSVGLNPAQIAAIFVAEASIIGLTAGGLGYLAGLGVYKGLAFFGLALEVRQKVSALWSLASIGIAMTAVLMGALAALKSSVVITPSLMRRWRIESQKGAGYDKPYEITIPVRMLSEEAEGFVEFVVQALRELENDTVKRTSAIKVVEREDEVRIDFVYKAPQSMSIDFYTKNSLHVQWGADDGEVRVRLMSFGEKGWAHIVGTLIRMIAMRWSTSQGKTPR
ncbi:MAG: hypothetical protein JSV18_05515 [Candidatus Bathyarchaeota archaeon]|nr:MAG: hypothetical protein JSV18_05515 [Candidatus Bathyarchaeota archaeon]